MVQFSHFCTRTVLLWLLHARAANAAHVPSGGDPLAMDSGFDEEDFDELDRHIDDIYSQSEVRVLCTLLTPAASQACIHFAKTERRVQRAYLWRGLKLGNINFVHAGASHSPHDIVSIKRPTVLTDDILDEELDNFDASEATRDAVRSLLSEGHDVSVEHVRNMKWNVDHLETFFSKIQDDLRYNDMPDRAPATQVEAVAYDDPRFADNEDVVNYRVNWRQLARERLSFLSTPWFARDKEEDLLKWARDEIDLDDLPDLDEDEARAMIVKELTHRASDIIDIEVNVDALLRFANPQDIHHVLVREIELLLERTYLGEPTRSAISAMDALRNIERMETERANTYRVFNDPAASELKPVRVESLSELRGTLDAVYQRAIVRREEFHKMTDPVVMTTDSRRRVPTFRVHFTDPERRYVNGMTQVVTGKSKSWYKALWVRLLEPIFNKVMLEELAMRTKLRNIVLVNAPRYTAGARVTAYVTNQGVDMIIHCDGVDENHAMAKETIEHEYEHVADHSTGCQTMESFLNTENERDIHTLTKDKLDELIKAKTVDIMQIESATEGAHPPKQIRLATHVTEMAAASRNRLLNTLQTELAALKREARTIMDNSWHGAFNVDGPAGGFVSWYARTNMGEAVAEQRAAMRTEAIRIALLRRMALDHPNAHAQLQKRFYDLARDVMKDTAPTLYAQWGEYYDNVARSHWGLLPGEHSRSGGRHHQIIALDHSLATKVASEKLATYFLLRGYDVAVMGMTTERDSLADQEAFTYSVESKLQSNFQDPPRGEVYPESTLHLVGGRSRGVDDIAVCVNDMFTRFTPTGRPDLGNLYRPNVGEVEVWRSPYERVKPRDGVDAEAKFVADFREKVKTMQLQKNLAWTVPDQILMRSDADHIPGMWPENPNMYQETVLRSWFDTDRNEWSEGGIETHKGLWCLQL